MRDLQLGNYSKEVIEPRLSHFMEIQQLRGHVKHVHTERMYSENSALQAQNPRLGGLK